MNRFITLKRVLIILLSLICLIPVAEAQNEMAGPGVSRELALHRRATISDLRYSLQFIIPEDDETQIIGKERLDFKITQSEKVILDFREQASKIKLVKVNGKAVECDIEFEHIIIPKKQIKKGKNFIEIDFLAGEQSLNRRKEFMYTLFVPDRARTAFPCIDQPDMKATFALTLIVPTEWTAVANGGLKKESRVKVDGKMMARFEFNNSELLPTYLFAFAAGKFEVRTFKNDNRIISAYFRETDPKRIDQLADIATEVFHTLKWQEEYTGQPYPFAKYDFVILPGFQFGGMEHTGCTFYNDNTLFLNENPTDDEILARSQLIAHETTHMWFGDLVTMQWFNDVWCKEVFANYFAAEITRQLLPNYNHDLFWLKTYQQAALTEDRTQGRTSIRQELDNLSSAGLVYNNIIYNKAPIMMKKLVELMGKEAFQRGIRKYVKKYAYGNATWEDMVEILSAETKADVKGFTDVWVNQKGMPTITLSLDEERDVTENPVKVEESDPLGRGLHWPQKYENKEFKSQILPNYDGKGYGFFTMEDYQLKGLMLRWPHITDATAKQSLLITLNENYLAKKISDSDWVDFLIDAMTQDQDKLTFSTLVSYMYIPMWLLPTEKKAEVEDNLLWLADTNKEKAGRIQLLRLLASTATSQPVVEELYQIWAHRGSKLLSVNDYMTFAYELAIRYPDSADEIIAEQRSRITNPDRQSQFDFVSRAVVASDEARDALFRSLLKPENRRIEPWTAQALYYLNHPLRDEYSSQYIARALKELPKIQKTGDIFFPRNWCNALLSGHHSSTACEELILFLSDTPDMPQLLKNKIAVSAYELMRAQDLNDEIFQ